MDDYFIGNDTRYILVHSLVKYVFSTMIRLDEYFFTKFTKNKMC